MQKYINVNGIKTYYKIEGNGAPLFLLHGWGERASDHFKFLAPLLKNKYKLIIIDLPGFGQTDEPKNVWDISKYADFVVNFADKLEIKKFNVLGFSFGGRISIRLSSKYRDKINKLFLVSSSGIGGKKNEKCNTSSLFHILKKIPMLRFIAYKTIYRKSDYYKLKGKMKITFQNIINEDLTNDLNKITAETVIIWGKNDNITLLESAYIINKNIKNSKLCIIDDASHFGFLKYKANEIAEIIK